MEVSFAKSIGTEVPASSVAAPPTPTPPTPPTPSTSSTPPTTALAAPCCGRHTSVLAPGGLLLGDKIPDFSEIVLPRINIVQNIGELKNSFPPGSLVLNQQVSLFIPPLVNAKTGKVEREATQPAALTVLGFRPTRYCEKIEGGTGRGIIVDSESSVRSAGGTLDYKEWELKKASGIKLFQPLADALVVVESPPDMKADDSMFSYEVASKRYALALWAMRGTSYTAAAKRVFFTARAVGNLRKGGYPSWSYAVSTREETYPGGNKAWIPVCLPKEKNSAEFINFVSAVLNAPQQSQQGEAV